jgi:hypothetical protein
LTTHINSLAGNHSGFRAPANPIIGFKDDDRLAGATQFACSGQTGKARSHHNNIHACGAWTA